MKIVTKLFVALGLLAFVCKAGAKEQIVVETGSTSLVFTVGDNGRLYQSYFGKRLTDKSEYAMLPQGKEAYMTHGMEDYFEPALHITRSDGNPSTLLKYKRHETKACDGGTETVIYLADPVYADEVAMHFVAYAKEDVFKAWTEIFNREKSAITLEKYASSMLHMYAPKYYLTQYNGDWATEAGSHTQELYFGKKVIDTKLGARADMFCQPFFQLSLGSKATEREGEVLVGTLAWTGNFRFTFEVDNLGGLRVISGINPYASQYTVAKNKSFRTPEFIFTLSQSGTGHASRNLHDWARKYQIKDGQGDRMTLLNNWEATYFDFDENKLLSLIGEAKELGVDMFLLDDGWFGNKYPRENDRAGLGDWQVNHKKLPNGVPYLVKTANEKGVEFGIWIEPEMVNPSSELAEKHPDWILRLPDRDTYYFRNQLVLDMTNPEVQNFVFGVVDNLMQENPNLKFFKWDCNSPITNIYSHYEKKNQGNLYVDYVRGLYKTLDRIQQKYPDLNMMMCSSGGGRCDFGALKYFTEFWCSDNTDPVERLFIQWGFSHFMPAKVMCAHVTNWNRRASVKFRTDVAFMCKLGFDIGLHDMAPADKAFCQNALKEYNRLKELVFSPMTYRLVSPYEGEHCVIERVSEDKSHAIVAAYDIHPRFSENIHPTRLQGLDADARYRVKEICLMPDARSGMYFNDRVYTGDYLMKVGLKMLTGGELSSRIIELVKE